MMFNEIDTKSKIVNYSLKELDKELAYKFFESDVKKKGK